MEAQVSIPDGEIRLASSLDDAVHISVTAHGGQTRKGVDEPYVLHPIRVMLMFGHERPIHRIVAVLHDVVEDTPWTAESFRAQWGGHPAVPLALDHISRRKADGETHREYINRVAENDIALVVKLADLRDNMRDPWWCPRGMLERYMDAYRYLAGIGEAKGLVLL